ncbi:MAG TPA: diguanylate cyclase [Solirubrobacteraceae bacterium]|nr:diguanylate cyclase [Solirubrobacteraceae bacterium]
MLPGPPRRRRARPVADAPIDALLERVEELTKGWLLTLLEQAPLDDAPGILAADLARDGPRVCAAVVRALADDDDLRRIEAGGALELLVARTGEFAGATRPEATSRAVDALSAVIWSAVRDELSHPEPEQVYELAERLAVVIELVRAAALRSAEAEPAVPGAEADLDPQPAGPPSQPRRLSSVSSTQSSRPAPVQPLEPLEPLGSRAPATEPLWMGALEDEILRSERSGAALALLLVELNDADRISAVESPREATATFGRFAQAVRSVVRRGDILACESETRAWIIARDTGRAGAQALAERAVSAVRAVRAWRGAPMTVSVGIAVLGEDGRDSDGLAEAADEARWAAAAAGTSVDSGSGAGAGVDPGLPAETAGDPGAPAGTGVDPGPDPDGGPGAGLSSP